MYLKVRERKMSAHLLACLPDTKKKILCEFTEKCFADFNQSSRVIYLTWYSLLLFFWELNLYHSFILWHDFKILVKSIGGGTFSCLASC